MITVSLRYQIGPTEYLAKERLLNGDTWEQATRTVWRDALLFLGLCLVGLLAGFLAENLFLMLIFLCALIARVTIALEFKKQFLAGMVALAEKKVRRRDVALRVDAEGVHEEVEEVRSFAPWSAVKSYAKADGVLMLELAGELWALIPSVAFLGAGAPSESEFMEMLQSKGVPSRESQTDHAGH